MAAEANMGFTPVDCLFSSVFGIADNDLIFQENPNPHQLLQCNNITLNQLPPPAAGPSSSSSTALTFFSTEFSQFLTSELEKQRAEMGSYLRFQNERLSAVLHEETRQRGVLLQSYASKLMGFIMQKESDLAMSNNRTMELQDCVIRLDRESKAWQNKALENEAVVIDLTNKVSQLKERICLIQNGAADAESFCDSSSSAMIRDQQASAGYCKLCRARSTCVLFFPCRHLCCCKVCEALLDFCPVCESLKETSMEVFLT